MGNRKSFHLDQAAIRMVKEPPLYSEFPLNSPQAVVKLLADIYKDYDREVFTVINLRPDFKPINLNIVSIGALDQAMAHPREVMKSAILSNASSIMLVHNHTTGSLLPSREDNQITDRMNQICGLMGIKLIDHVIIGPRDEYYPAAMERFKQQFPVEAFPSGKLSYANSPVEALEGANICFIFTEWAEIKGLGADEFVNHMRTPLVYDGRNLFEQKQMKNSGVEYYSIGRQIKSSR